MLASYLHETGVPESSSKCDDVGLGTTALSALLACLCCPLRIRLETSAYGFNASIRGKQGDHVFESTRTFGEAS